MSVEVSRLAWGVELPPTEKFVLVALADFASPDGTDVYPSTALLARRTGWDERTIYKARSSLRKRGVLITVKPSTFNHPTIYRIDVKELKQLVGRSHGTSRPERRSPPEPDSSPETGSPPERDGRGGVNQVPGGGEPGSSKPPIEPPIEPPPPGGGESNSNDAIDAEVEAEWERTPNKAGIRYPEMYKAKIGRRLQAERRDATERQKKNRQHQATVDDCRLCTRAGWVLLVHDAGQHTERCTHNRDDYSGYEIATESHERGEAVA